MIAAEPAASAQPGAPARPLAPEAARLVADLLSYPTEGLPERASLAARAVPPTVAAPALRCAAALAAIGTGEAQELYTATFDLRPASSPYVGLCLCGEGARRNALLAYLAEAYAAAGHAPGEELPDHLAEVLRFIADAGGTEEARDLAELAVAPCARRLAAELPADNPYRAAVVALLRALGGDPEEVAP